MDPSGAQVLRDVVRTAGAAFGERMLACYALGSSRRVQLRAAPCKHRRKCGEECSGCAKKPWFNSGSNR